MVVRKKQQTSDKKIFMKYFDCNNFIMSTYVLNFLRMHHMLDIGGILGYLHFTDNIFEKCCDKLR